MSTSIAHRSGQVEWTIKVKSGAHVAGISHYPHEQEVLLRPGRKLRIMKIISSKSRSSTGTTIEHLAVEAEEL